jgi:UDP-2,4-diacetamido-2,4,6-trideoxy-beta-L-altropyranose hydrolase
LGENTIIIRADASPGVGLGHVIRSQALAEILSGKYRIHFICEDSIAAPVLKELKSAADEVTLLPLSHAHWFPEVLPDLDNLKVVVVDGYSFDISEISILRDRGIKIIKITDEDMPIDGCDAIISHSFWKSTQESQSLLLLGVEHALVRKEFRHYAERIAGPVMSVVICCGGLDTHGYAQKILPWILDISPSSICNIVIGPYDITTRIKFGDHPKVRIYQHMNALEMSGVIRQSQLAITSASGIAVEAASIGISLGIGHYVSNQFSMYQQFVERGLAVGLGDFRELDESQFKLQWKSTLSVESEIHRMLITQGTILDGRSAHRIQDFMQKVIDA